jgi:phosphopantothenoylcysteine decarboxylase/phosphopantothenate--cysteine ligase
MGLKNKKILITAGPTWVAIDPVRVISNIATGQTGKSIAQLAALKGAKVSLLLSSDKKEKIRGMRVKTFRYFQQLRSLLAQELKKHSFDCIIHNAAVSDYLINNPSGKKIDSAKRRVSLELVRAPKLIRQIRQKQPGSLLVMFKLDTDVSERLLILKARQAQQKAGADIVVANTFCNKRLKAFIYNHHKLLAKADSRDNLARRLISVLEKKL